MQLFVALTGVLPKYPAIYTTWRQEVAPPYRRCTRALVFRVSRRHAVVVGRWKPTQFTEDQALATVFGEGPSPVGTQW